MRERITSAEYSELTDIYNAVFDGAPLEAPSLVKNRGIVGPLLFGKEYRSSREANVVWIERNTPQTVPLELESYQREKGVRESKKKTIYPLGQVGQNNHIFTIHDGPMMGADYQLGRELNQTLIIDIETMLAFWADTQFIPPGDPVATFCRRAISHINEMNERNN